VTASCLAGSDAWGFKSPLRHACDVAGHRSQVSRDLELQRRSSDSCVRASARSAARPLPHTTSALLAVDAAVCRHASMRALRRDLRQPSRRRHRPARQLGTGLRTDRIRPLKSKDVGPYRDAHPPRAEAIPRGRTRRDRVMAARSARSVLAAAGHPPGHHWADRHGRRARHEAPHNRVEVRTPPPVCRIRTVKLRAARSWKRR
jgi:hypothetical protein